MRHGEPKLKKREREILDEEPRSSNKEPVGLEKKKKKSKRETGTDAEHVDSGTGSDIEHVEKKKEKKKKKKQQQQQQQEQDDEEELAVAGSSEGAAEQNGSAKKKKSKGENGDASAAANGAKVAKDENGKAEQKIVLSGNGSAAFRPLASFDDAGLPDDVLAECRGFAKPSPIQAHSWPVLLAGRDLIGIAKTGSGKTLAFGVPAVNHACQKKGGGGGGGKGKKEGKGGKGAGAGAGGRGPLCLILAPTRELAQQIAGVLEATGEPCGLRTVCVYGGASKKDQRDLLRNKPEIVVATPGRLQDFADEGSIDLSSVTNLILDEADRMLDLGFEPAIRAIVALIPKERQTMMFSATWPPAVGQLASQYLQDPVKVTVGSEELTANHDVKQIVEVIEDRARDMRLDTLLQGYHKSRTNRVLIFVLYKKEAERVENMLRKRGWKVAGVHGDKSQADRERAVGLFRDGVAPLLIATDVAARGLDIPDVEYVINYSFPLTVEDYVHRIGRTGRAGRKGTAYTFFTHNDRLRAGELVNVLREAGQDVPESLLKFGTHVKKKESKLYGAHFKEIGADAPKATKIKFDSDDDE